MTETSQPLNKFLLEILKLREEKIAQKFLQALKYEERQNTPGMEEARKRFMSIGPGNVPFNTNEGQFYSKDN